MSIKLNRKNYRRSTDFEPKTVKRGLVDCEDFKKRANSVLERNGSATWGPFKARLDRMQAKKAEKLAAIAVTMACAASVSGAATNAPVYETVAWKTLRGYVGDESTVSATSFFAALIVQTRTNSVQIGTATIGGIQFNLVALRQDTNHIVLHEHRDGTVESWTNTYQGPFIQTNFVPAGNVFRTNVTAKSWELMVQPLSSSNYINLLLN